MGTGVIVGLPRGAGELLGDGRPVAGGLAVRGGAGGLVVEGREIQAASAALGEVARELLDRAASTATGAVPVPVATSLDPAGALAVADALAVALGRLAVSAAGCEQHAALLRAAGVAYAGAEDAAGRSVALARDAVARAAGQSVGGVLGRPDVVVAGGAVVLVAVTTVGLARVVVRGAEEVGAEGDRLLRALADGRLDTGERERLHQGVVGAPGRVREAVRGDVAAVGGALLDELSSAAAVHPEALELLVGGLPALVTGAVGAAVPGAPPGAVGRGPTGARELPGGDRWTARPRDVAELAAAVAVLATQDGALRPTDVHVSASEPVAVAPAAGVADLLARAAPMAGGGALSPGGRGRSAAPVHVERVVDAAGARRWVLVLPPTQTTANPVAASTTNPADLGTDVRAVGQVPSAMSRGAVQALRDAGVRPDEPVMLVGYSQGGILAAQLAADPALREEVTVDVVLTAGAPTGGFDVPPDVAVLSLEHDEDWIRALDGGRNPVTPGWTTVHRDLTDVGVLDRAALVEDGMAAHDLDLYRETAALVDASDDPSLVAWRERAAPYLAAAGTTASVQLHHAERVPVR